MRRPTLRVTRRLDGTWSAAKLFPPPKFGDRPPEVTVENGTIEIFDPTKSPAGTLTLRDVNLTVHPTIETAPGGGVKEIRNLAGDVRLRLLPPRGISRNGRSAERGLYVSPARRRGLDISPELRDALPEPLCAKMNAWGELRAEGKFDFQVAYDPAQPTPLTFPHRRFDLPRADQRSALSASADRRPREFPRRQLGLHHRRPDGQEQSGVDSDLLLPLQPATKPNESQKAQGRSAAVGTRSPVAAPSFARSVAGTMGQLSTARQNRRRRDARFRRPKVAAGNYGRAA